MGAVQPGDFAHIHGALTRSQAFIGIRNFSLVEKANPSPVPARRRGRLRSTRSGVFQPVCELGRINMADGQDPVACP